jgi:hypothetical protein
MKELAAKLGGYHYSIYKGTLKAACKSPDLLLLIIRMLVCTLPPLDSNLRSDFFRLCGVRASEERNGVLARIFVGGEKECPGFRDVGLYSWLRTGGIRRNRWRHLRLNAAVT